MHFNIAVSLSEHILNALLARGTHCDSLSSVCTASAVWGAYSVTVHNTCYEMQGNALLVGVGGSGKQSLARLAAFISGCEVFEITLTRGYDETMFREDLKQLYSLLGSDNKKVLPTLHLCVHEIQSACTFCWLCPGFANGTNYVDLLPASEGYLKLFFSVQAV